MKFIPNIEEASQQTSDIWYLTISTYTQSSISTNPIFDLLYDMSSQASDYAETTEKYQIEVELKYVVHSYSSNVPN